MMTIMAVRFVLRSMLPSRCQLLIRGPNVPCSRNQPSSRSEDRANAKAATNRNGVVGNRGSTTPTAPTATAARPANNQRIRIFPLILAVDHTTTSSGKPSFSAFRWAIFQLLLESAAVNCCSADKMTGVDCPPQREFHEDSISAFHATKSRQLTAVEFFLKYILVVGLFLIWTTGTSAETTAARIAPDEQFVALATLRAKKWIHGSRRDRNDNAPKFCAYLYRNAQS